MTHKATCRCGQLSVQLHHDRPNSSICHCHDCQRRTGSVFGVQIRVKQEDITIEGDAKTWMREGEEGHQITFSFCPTCGATVYWMHEALEGSVIIAVGAFADATCPAPTFSVYEARQHPWVILPESVTTHWD